MGLAALHISRGTWEQLDSPLTDDDIKQKLLLGAEWSVHTLTVPPDESDTAIIHLILKHKDIPDDGGIYELYPHYNWRHEQGQQMHYTALEGVEVRKYANGVWQTCATIL